MQITIGTALFPFYLNPFTKALTLINVPSHHDFLYHPYDLSAFDSPTRYNLLQVQLSLVDAYQPLLSFTYTSIYNEEYINCTTRTLGL